MKDINRVILVGRLGADPITRHTKSGIPVSHFSIATTRRFLKAEPTNGGSTSPDNSPQYAEETQWHRIVAWGRLAETCSKYLKKGNPVYLEGAIRSHTYDDKDGKSIFCFEIHADNVSFLGTRRPESTGEGSTEEAVETTQEVLEVESVGF